MDRPPIVAAILALAVSACAPGLVAPGPAIGEARLTGDAFIAADGANLPLRQWIPDERPARAIIIAVHGFNDYSNFFDDPGLYLAQKWGIASYAYDQRGFGGAPHRGRWAGVAGYTDDLIAFAGAVRRRHPGLPLYLLGESMGGAVIMIAMTGPGRPETDGIILAAPAVWGRATMPWYQRWSLWLGAHTVPWLTGTGQGLNIKPSDNIEMLIELGKDPLVIKKTRIDAIYGLANLMDAALEGSSRLDAPALILYGERDEIIPKKPTAMMLERLPGSTSGRQRAAIYQTGYHMLLRDLGASVPWKDIAAWTSDPTQPLPSGADTRSLSALIATKESPP